MSRRMQAGIVLVACALVWTWLYDTFEPHRGMLIFTTFVMFALKRR